MKQGILKNEQTRPNQVEEIIHKDPEVMEMICSFVADILVKAHEEVHKNNVHEISFIKSPDSVMYSIEVL